MLLPAPAELVAVPPLQVVAQLPLLELPPLLAQPPLLVLLRVVVQLPLLVLLAEEAVELLTRSFSAAMAGILPSPGPPMYAPAPRSRRKPKRRLCPLT